MKNNPNILCTRRRRGPFGKGPEYTDYSRSFSDISLILRNKKDRGVSLCWNYTENQTKRCTNSL